MFEFLAGIIQSKTSMSAIASFLVAVFGPKLGLDPTTAYQIAGAIGTLAVLFLRSAVFKAQTAAESSGVSPEIINEISKAVVDAFPGRKIGVPE